MKLLIVTQKVNATDSNLGFFVRWIEEFSKQAEVTVIANEVDFGTSQYLLEKGIQVDSLGKENGISRSARLFRYRELLHKHLPGTDGVFFHMCPEYVLAAGLLPKKFGKKSILWYTHKEVSLRLRLASLLVNKIFTASKESCRLSSKKVEVVGHGIDTELFSPEQTEGRIVDTSFFRLLTVGRISPVKDIQTLIFGFRELQERLPNVSLRLAIFGTTITEADAQYKKELDLLVAPFSQQVDWGPLYHDAVASNYSWKGVTVFVHASKTGSMDKAVLEALSAGLPVFTSSEAFSPDIPGITRFKKGDPTDLALRISRAFKGNLGVIGGAGRAYVGEHHSLKRLIPRILSSLQS